MALHDEILADIVTGTIPVRFRVANLMTREDPEQPGHFIVGAGSYSANALKVIPANHSISKDGTVKGDYIKKGREPAYIRLGGGEYELIVSRRHKANLNREYELLEDSEGDGESLIGNGETELDAPLAYAVEMEAGLEESSDPVKIIVNALALRPYSAYFKRQQCQYPEPAVVGWEARLDAYFWPTFRQNWLVNRVHFAEFDSRFRKVTRNWDVESDVTKTGILSLFRDICVWGNVKLPEENSDILVREVDEALRHIDASEIPNNCRMNSAWTKLYAVARPDSFVIYDSRVATAIVSLLDPYMQQLEGTQKFEPYRDLGYVNGRGGTRPRILRWGWGNGYKSWKAQYAANRLCRAIVQQLNEAYPKNKQEDVWSMREVEAVLFMEGY